MSNEKTKYFETENVSINSEHDNEVCRTLYKAMKCIRGNVDF